MKNTYVLIATGVIALSFYIGFLYGRSGIPGDINHDGRVDVADLSALAGNWDGN